MRIQKVLPEGVQLCYFFYEEKQDPNSTKRGPALNAGLVVLLFFRESVCATCKIPIFQLASVAQLDTVVNPEDVFFGQQGPTMIIT